MKTVSKSLFILVVGSLSLTSYAGIYPDVEGNVVYSENNGDIIIQSDIENNTNSQIAAGLNVVQTSDGNSDISINGAIAINHGTVDITLDAKDNEDSQIGAGMNVIQSK